MQFSNEILIQITIFVLGLCGFWVARHIYRHKKIKKPLICPIGFDCNFVVHSDYSEFMHVPLEVFGMIYYALLSLSYLFFIFFLEAMPDIVSLFLLVASFGAFVFSLYLLFIQIFILRKGCSWCIVSALITILIFILTLFSFDFISIAKSL